MNREIELIRSSAKRIVVKVREGGEAVARLGCTPDSQVSRAAVTRILGVDDKTFLAWVDAMDASVMKIHTVVISPDGVGEPSKDQVTAGGTYTVRGFDSADGTDHSLPPLAAVTDLLPAVGSDQLLTWQGKAAVCCLDIDYHDTKPPRPDLLETWVRDRVAPKPLAWHFSRNGGLHLFYVQSPPFTAEGLAAMAALRWRTFDPTAGVELKTQVRGPGKTPVHFATAQDTVGSLSAWIGVESCADEDEVTDWLARHDLEIGERYGHERCPIDPKAVTTAVNNPVTVTQYGVYCHRCAGHGLSIGSRKPGFVPWSALCGSPSSGDLGRMVREMAHWGQAGVILRHKYDIPDSLGRPAYECALTARHDADPRISLVFHRDSGKLARSNDSWVNVESGYVYQSNFLQPLIQILPACCRMDEDKIKPVPSTVALFMQGHDLSDRGYDNIRVIHGFSFAKPFMPPTPQQPAVVTVLADSLRSVGNKVAPRYLPAGKRKPLAWAERVLTDCFPGINLRCVRAIICAVACAQETKLGMHPILFIAGPSASGKTIHGKIAAGILGSRTTAVVYTADESRLKQAVKGAVQTSCLVQADEFLKEGRRVMRRNDPKAVLDALLTLTGDTACHELYVGPRKLGQVPAIVLSEPICPVQIADHTQVARRIRYLKLPQRNDSWKEAMAKLGLTGDSLPRLRAANADLCEACDVLLSDLVDRYFSVPMTWDAIADDLDVRTIEDSPEFPTAKDHMRRFFELVCTMAAQPDKTRTKWPASQGWRRINRNEAMTDDLEELVSLYDMFADGTHGAAWLTSEVLAAADWTGVVGAGEPVHYDFDSDRSSTVYVRFYQGRRDNPTAINGRIVCDTLKQSDGGRGPGTSPDPTPKAEAERGPDTQGHGAGGESSSAAFFDRTFG